MKFELFWGAIMTRNCWRADSELSVKASGVEKLAQKAFQEGFREGVASVPKPSSSSGNAFEDLFGAMKSGKR